MSLAKAIQYGKEHREPYRGSKANARWCRNHGACSLCRRNRTHKNDVRELAADEEIREFFE